MKNEYARRFAAPREGIRALLATTALALLVSCGGGGGGSSPPPVLNQAPIFTSANAATYVENGTDNAYQATATDAEGGALTFTITGGADAVRFVVTPAGQLRFVAPPNFDLATDANGDNVYQVQLTVSDGQVSSALTLALTVTNSKEGISVRRVGTGFASPAAIAFTGTADVLVAEKSGAVYRLDPQTGFRTLLVQIENVSSVLAMVTARDFGTTGTFYVMYTTSGGLVVNRFLRNPAGPTVPDNFGPLLAVPAPQYAGGGWLGLDPEGNLLIATGDGGGSGDPSGSAQDNGSRLGKVLRVTRNPDPYAGATVNFSLLTMIAKGLHRPNGGTIYANGLLIADSGQDVAEEVDYLAFTAGSVNFGWPFKEGTSTVRGAPPGDAIDPVIEYSRGTGTRAGLAIIGGAIGSSAIASLRDQYVFADRRGAIFTVPTSSIQPGRTLASTALEVRDADFIPDRGAIDRPVAVTAGPTGTIYIVDDDGDIFRVDPG